MCSVCTVLYFIIIIVYYFQHTLDLLFKERDFSKHFYFTKPFFVDCRNYPDFSISGLCIKLNPEN